MLHLLLENHVKLEDVFKSTRESMGESEATPGRFLPLAMAALGLVLLLIVLHFRRQRAANRAALNSPRKLIKEVGRVVPIRGSEIKQLREIAEGQKCESPLTLLLCPSLLAKGVKTRTPDQRRALAGLVRRMK
jgi:hypothetical protein